MDEESKARKLLGLIQTVKTKRTVGYCGILKAMEEGARVWRRRAMDTRHILLYLLGSSEFLT